MRSPIGERCAAWREPIAGEWEPEDACEAIRGDRDPFALIGRWGGGGALLGSEPVAVAADDDDPFARIEDQPQIDELEAALAESPGVSGPADDPASTRSLTSGSPNDSQSPTGGREDPQPSAGRGHEDAQPFVGGGWFGYLGYGLGASIESLDPQPPAPTTLPRHRLAFYDHLIRMDREGRWWFEALITPEREVRIRARLELLRSRLAKLAVPTARTEPTAPRPFSTAPWRSTPGPEGHGRAVEACRERIRGGDLFQANICLRLDSRLEGEPLDLFTAAAQKLRPDRAAFLQGSWGALASLSPELYLERRGSRVRTAPIKGTMPRPADPAQAAEMRDRLAASGKDLAENQMILDMARNDLGRVCSYGSVEVVATTEPRAHAGVWHLVSEVEGELHPSQSDRDLLRATFPPASVTGAPKIAAENVIAELESTARQAYTGAIGFAAPAAGLELSVAIRTFEVRDEAVWLGLGGGIVSDSDPEDEAAECRVKAAPLLEAIGGELTTEEAGGQAPAQLPGGAGRLATPRPAGPVPVPMRLGSRPVPRPDPRAGVFETVRVEDGRIAHLEDHLARIERSLGELYGAALPHDLESRLSQAASELSGIARLRFDLAPAPADGHSGAAPPRIDPALGPAGGNSGAAPPRSPGTAGVELSIQTSPIEPRNAADRPAPVVLQPVTIPGGLGDHKWADRRLIDALAQAVAPRVPLICDLDGYVLEASRASVIYELPSGTRVVPPLDGRILPGTTRSRLLGPGDEERPILLGELAGPGRVLLASATAVLVEAALGSDP